MTGKKDYTRFNLKFDSTEPVHENAIKMLYSAGRKKAQLVSRALLLLKYMTEAGLLDALTGLPIALSAGDSPADRVQTAVQPHQATSAASSLQDSTAADTQESSLDDGTLDDGTLGNIDKTLGGLIP